MSLTALIIDDEPLARQELQYLLERAGGVEVLALGTNGIEAVELIRTHKPDVVFLDVQMPGLDGFGVLKKLLDRKVPTSTGGVCDCVQPVCRSGIRGECGRLPAEAVRSQARDADDREGAGAAGRTAESAELRGDGAKLDALLRLVEEQAQPQKANSGKVIVRAQSRLLLVDQREICFASIEEGTISVVTGRLRVTPTAARSKS